MGRRGRRSGEGCALCRRPDRTDHRGGGVGSDARCPAGPMMTRPHLPLRLIPLDLGSERARELREGTRSMAGDWILSAFERFERVFVLSSRSSPGLAFVGAQASAHPFDVVAPTPIRFSAGGTGVSLEEALISCL